jgi:hypothetical protein
MPERRTMQRVSCVALKPDGSSESVWRTDLPGAATLDHTGRVIGLPKGTRLFPFDSSMFMTVPTYAEAEAKNLGIKVDF